MFKNVLTVVATAIAVAWVVSVATYAESRPVGKAHHAMELILSQNGQLYVIDFNLSVADCHTSRAFQSSLGGKVSCRWQD